MSELATPKSFLEEARSIARDAIQVEQDYSVYPADYIRETVGVHEWVIYYHHARHLVLNVLEDDQCRARFDALGPFELDSMDSMDTLYTQIVYFALEQAALVALQTLEDEEEEEADDED